MGQGCPGEDTGQTVDIEELKTKVGQPIGTSEWVEVGQDRIEAFAETTLDFDPIHVDPQAAHNAGFEGTIAHGFLSLSLLAPFYKSGYPKIERRSYGLNYGLNRRLQGAGAIRVVLAGRCARVPRQCRARHRRSAA